MEPITISALGALVGLGLAIVLIFLDLAPVYSLMLGAFVGGLVGGATASGTIDLMIMGAGSMMATVLRILSAGVMAGILVKSGAAQRIASSIVGVFGKDRAMLALSLSTMVLTGVGIFVDIAVITVAPIGLLLANDLGYRKSGIFIAMVGGGKAGNIISPNPNTIALAEGFNVDLSTLMLGGMIPALAGLVVTYILSQNLKNEGSIITREDLASQIDDEDLPSLLGSLAGPLIAIFALGLRPLFGINIDPMVALPLGGLLGGLLMKKHRDLLAYIGYGLESMTQVSIILIGTGAMASIIQHSSLGLLIIQLIEDLGLPIYLLAPISAILMSAATSSTTSAASVTSQVFGPSLKSMGVAGLSSGVMINAGSTVFDSLIHGSFFHASQGAVNMDIKERLNLIIYEVVIGLSMTIVAVIIYGYLGQG